MLRKGRKAIFVQKAIQKALEERRQKAKSLAISTKDVYMYIPKKYQRHIAPSYVRTLLSEARKAPGGPEELTPEQRGRLIHEAARARGTPGSIVREIIEELVPESKRGKVAFSPMELLRIAHERGYTHITKTHVYNALRRLNKAGIVRLMTPQERLEYKRRWAAEKDSKANIIYNYIKQHYLAGGEKPAISAPELASRMRLKGYDVDNNIVQYVLSKLQKQGLISKFNKGHMHSRRKEDLAKIPLDIRKKITTLMSKARYRGLSYDERCDLLSYLEEATLWRLKQDPAFFLQSRTVKRDELVKHITNYYKEAGEKMVAYGEPLLKELLMAINIVLSTRNKGLERKKLVQELIAKGIPESRARKAIVTLVDIGALGEFGPAKKSLGNKYVIVYPAWWTYRKFAP